MKIVAREVFSLLYIIASFMLASLNGAVAQIDFEGSQAANIARVKIGDDIREFDVRVIARAFAPYSLLAVQAYSPLNNILYREKSAFEKELLGRPRTWVEQNWKGVNEHNGVVPCTAEHPCRGIPVGGLSVQFWRNNTCTQAAVIFRGTDFKLLDFVVDGVSNLRPIFRIFPIEDQYDQARRLMQQLAHYSKNDACFRRAVLNTIGHSLGGGLAQHAAYANPNVRTVYAFDPSFVTGASAFETNALRDPKRRLVINRIFEDGEILAFPRRLVESLFVPPPCNPTVRLVRLNSQDGSLLQQHSIDALAYNLFGHWQPESNARKSRPPLAKQVTLAERQRVNCQTGVLY